ncbi:MAG TPA: hypothetical protein VNI57_06625 [Candidatus Saccharimonadales bacterium]|nr:hypothetical protein [Candidatus Saccharimonadales bacterium]
MRPHLPLLLLAVTALAAAPAGSGKPKPGSDWAAMSQCSKSVKGQDGEITVEIGVMAFDLDKAACDRVGDAKAEGMAKGGWTCTGKSNSEESTNHLCIRMSPAQEEQGLRDIRARRPISQTYLAFTDLQGHSTQMSFWDLEPGQAMKLCDAFRQDFEKSGVKDAQCIPGTGR